MTWLNYSIIHGMFDRYILVRDYAIKLKKNTTKSDKFTKLISPLY